MKLVVFFVLWLQNTQELEKSANFADFSYLAIKLVKKFCLSTPRQYRQLSLQSKTYIKVVLVHIKVFSGRVGGVVTKIGHIKQTWYTNEVLH